MVVKLIAQRKRISLVFLQPDQRLDRFLYIAAECKVVYNNFQTVDKPAFGLSRKRVFCTNVEKIEIYVQKELKK